MLVLGIVLVMVGGVLALVVTWQRPFAFAPLIMIVVGLVLGVVGGLHVGRHKGGAGKSVSK